MSARLNQILRDMPKEALLHTPPHPVPLPKAAALASGFAEKLTGMKAEMVAASRRVALSRGAQPVDGDILAGHASTPSKPSVSKRFKAKFKG